MEKPIHSMGVGLVGNLKMFPSQWSGIFKGGEFPVLARASISQGNPLKVKTDGSAQKRSAAMAIKVFTTVNPDEKVNTANAVFQNNLNGLLNSALHWVRLKIQKIAPVNFHLLIHKFAQARG